MNEVKVPRYRIQPKDLADVYDAIDFYMRERHQDFTVDELIVVRKVLNNIESEFNQVTKTENDIVKSRHGHCGRKETYSSDNAKQILDLRATGMSMRKIAEQLGCSPQRVKTVLDREKPIELPQLNHFWTIIDGQIERREHEKIKTDVEPKPEAEEKRDQEAGTELPENS